VAAGGRALPEAGPYCFAPTVLTDVPSDAKLFRGEVFGPVLAVSSFGELDWAIDQANDTEYGLNASVVGPQAAAIEVAKRLNAGSVNVNEGYRASFASMESPMGGMKLSGLGRRNGPAGLLKYTNAKSIGVARDGVLAKVLRLPNRASEWKRMAPLFGVILRWMRRF
jgi:succinate-semialdehyde dehydrogenase/glutarate-semialdehyde dehydrogenase